RDWSSDVCSSDLRPAPSSTSKLMAASIPTPHACRSKTEPMSLLQALPSSAQKIMGKRSGNCAALDSACLPGLRKDIALVVADLGENTTAIVDLKPSPQRRPAQLLRSSRP